MMTVEPFAALPDPGTWLKTVPFGYWAEPDPCWLMTCTPAWVRIWVAVPWESATTEGTGTAPPDTVMVTVEPGGAVPALGLWVIAWPVGRLEVGSDLTLTLKPLPCRTEVAAVCVWPTTFGTATGAAPVETYSVTTVFAETLLPSGGLDLITIPLVTLAFACWMTVERRCAAQIFASPPAPGSPFTTPPPPLAPPPFLPHSPTPAPP